MMEGIQLRDKLDKQVNQATTDAKTILAVKK